MKHTAEKYLPKDTNSGYTPAYARRTGVRFSPKKAVRSFRDLDVYRNSMECSVLVGKHITPELEDLKYPFVSDMRSFSLSIPLLVAESHGMRFDDFDGAVSVLERAMQRCNKMIVFLEQVSGLYGEEIDATLAETLAGRYMNTRGKMLRLLRSWQKFRAARGE